MFGFTGPIRGALTGGLSGAASQNPSLNSTQSNKPKGKAVSGGDPYLLLEANSQPLQPELSPADLRVYIYETPTASSEVKIDPNKSAPGDGYDIPIKILKVIRDVAFAIDPLLWPFALGGCGQVPETGDIVNVGDEQNTATDPSGGALRPFDTVYGAGLYTPDPTDAQWTKRTIEFYIDEQGPLNQKASTVYFYQNNSLLAQMYGKEALGLTGQNLQDYVDARSACYESTLGLQMIGWSDWCTNPGDYIDPISGLPLVPPALPVYVEEISWSCFDPTYNQEIASDIKTFTNKELGGIDVDIAEVLMINLPEECVLPSGGLFVDGKIKLKIDNKPLPDEDPTPDGYGGVFQGGWMQ